MKFMNLLRFAPVGFAVGEGSSSFDMTSVMSGAVETVQGQILSVLAIVVPAIVVVVGAVVGVRFGISWLKKLRG